MDTMTRITKAIAYNTNCVLNGCHNQRDPIRRGHSLDGIRILQREPHWKGTDRISNERTLQIQRPMDIGKASQKAYYKENEGRLQRLYAEQSYERHTDTTPDSARHTFIGRHTRGRAAHHGEDIPDGKRPFMKSNKFSYVPAYCQLPIGPNP